MSTNTLIIAFFDGDPEVKILSNFAHTPFELDGYQYESVEGFWQSLKTEDEELRNIIRTLYGISAKRAGRMVRGSASVFTYMNNLYRVGSEAHHKLFERAIRAKVSQNKEVEDSLRESGNLILKHMLKNKYNQWRVGDSPSLPAFVFENILMKIRTELQQNSFVPTLELPKGITED
jgi:predicted NAD-dependent protein-ADP-ribosyltransferase YbiA (DUF1768 family)